MEMEMGMGMVIVFLLQTTKVYFTANRSMWLTPSSSSPMNSWNWYIYPRRPSPSPSHLPVQVVYAGGDLSPFHKSSICLSDSEIDSPVNGVVVKPSVSF